MHATIIGITIIRESVNYDNELNTEKRTQIANALLLRDPPTFVERYGKYLKQPQLQILEKFSGNFFSFLFFFSESVWHFSLSPRKRKKIKFDKQKAHETKTEDFFD